MKKLSGKYYYDNILSSQNVTAKPNVAWSADITHLELAGSQKISVFICIDLHTNYIISFIVSKKEVTSKAIVRSLSSLIEKRFVTKPDTKLVIHTDGGAQFTSENYFKFTSKYQDIFEPSMSRVNTPTDNAVMERLNRTFKEFRINGRTCQEELNDELLFNPEFKSYRKVVRKYIEKLNSRPNRKSSPKGPQRHDLDTRTASMLMGEPRYTKAFSEHFGEDLRRGEIARYKEENAEVVSILKAMAAKQAEVVDRTPFDVDFENSLYMRVLNDQLMEIYSQILANPTLTKEYVEEALSPVVEGLDEIKEMVKTLMPKKKIDREVLPLRDGIDVHMLPIFLAHAGKAFTYQRDLKRCQLRIAYTILYHVGSRINEIRTLTKQDIENAITTSQFSLVHYKTKQPHIHVLSDVAVEDLASLKDEFRVVFEKYNYKYLFGKENPIHNKTLIGLTNKDLKHTCKLAKMPYNIRSHSFRVNKITSLLKRTSIQNAAQIIGHKDLKSTMSYKRYALTKNEIKDLLNQIEEGEANS